jgi:hypothetical protein
MTAPKPTFFLAFANSAANPLPNLAWEAALIREALQRAKEKGLCNEPIGREHCTPGELLTVFRNQDDANPITALHYGGHASGVQLDMEPVQETPGKAHAEGLAQFLGVQARSKGLHLVFLNGCSTQEQARLLLREGVRAVIVTDHRIDDDIAAQFAGLFYQELAAGKDLATAFECQRALKTGHQWALQNRPL